MGWNELKAWFTRDKWAQELITRWDRARLEQAIRRGVVDASTFKGSTYNLDLSGREYRGVRFVGDFTAARLCRAHCIDCDFTKATLDCAQLSLSRFERCNLRTCPIRWSELGEARFVQCDLTRARFNKSKLFAVRFSRCDLRGADLTEASGERLCLAGVRTDRNTFAVGVDFERAQFVPAEDGTRCEIAGQWLGAKLHDLKCDRTVLSADLQHADLHSARLSHCDLNGCNLNDAKLRRVSTRDCQLAGLRGVERRKLDLLNHPGRAASARTRPAPPNPNKRPPKQAARRR